MANQGRTGHRSKLVFWACRKAYEILYCYLIHVNRTFGSHDMVIHTSHLCRCLTNNLIDVVPSIIDRLGTKESNKCVIP